MTSSGSPIDAEPRDSTGARRTAPNSTTAHSPSLRRLEYFAALAEHLHFARTAEALGISQPALSAEIRKLEAECGVRLFSRSPTTALTREGTLLLRDAHGVLETSARFAAHAGDLASGMTGSLVIGTVQSFCYRGVPQAIRRLADARPGLRVRTLELPTAEQRSRLLSGAIDLACGHMPIRDDGIVSTAAVGEPFVLCLPSHLRAGSLAEAAAEPFIVFRREASPYYHDRVLSVWRETGIRPDIRHETNTWESAVELVAHGLGVALVPQGVAQRHCRDPRIRTLPCASAARSEAWVSRREADTTVVAEVGEILLDALRTV
jgi:DNA-binding transcriptional LysR family regulator